MDRKLLIGIGAGCVAGVLIGRWLRMREEAAPPGAPPEAATRVYLPGGGRFIREYGRSYPIPEAVGELEAPPRPPVARYPVGYYPPEWAEIGRRRVVQQVVGGF